MKYDVIYADPPWDYGKMKDRKKNYRGGNPQSHYKTMHIQEIIDLPIQRLSNDSSCLFLWITNPKIQLGFQVMSAWGFKYQTMITWVKINRNGELNRGGLGFYFRGATEHILFGTRGEFKIPTGKRLPNVIFAEKSRHSYKPVEAYELIENTTIGNRLELFARNQRNGWNVWGDEIKSSIDLRVVVE